MSLEGILVAKRNKEKEDATGEGGETDNNKNNKIENNKERRNIIEETRMKDLRSRFGEAFLPYANTLESVEKIRIDRKRRGRNIRNQPPTITNIPKYTNDTTNRINQYHNKRDNNVKKLGEKVRRISSEEDKRRDQLQWKGDTMSFSDNWPNTDERRTMRIFHINLNGVTYQNKLLEWEMTVAFLMDMQVDIFGLTEINLDLNNGMVKDSFIQAAKHFDPYLRIETSSSLQKIGDSPFKMGGTVTGANGCWSGRISRQGKDKLGRWSFMSLHTKHGNQVMVVTVYLPGKPSSSGKGTTIYNQMEADLLKETGKLLEPRKELLKDLHEFIRKEIGNGSQVILMGDMNDNLGLKTGQVRSFLSSLGMKITFEMRHGDNNELPPTHDRGKTCLDMIGCSENIPDNAIVKAGYAPFYFNFFTDHRGVYIDLDIEIIFNSIRPDTTKQIYKRFTTQHVPKCARYLKKLEEMMEKSKMFKKVDALEIDYKKYKFNPSKELREEIIIRTKGLFTQVTEFMKCAERSAGPMPYRDGFPDSPNLRQAAFKVVRLKKYLRMIALGTIESDKKEKGKVVNEIKEAQLWLRKQQNSSTQIRRLHMESLAEKRCHQWQMNSAEALHIILESEKSKLLHGKHRRLLKSNNDGTLRSLMIPAPITGLKNNEKDPRLYTNITDSKQMFNILLKRNFNHLMQSKEAMFTNGPLLEKCGWYGEEDGMEDLLEGLLDVENIANHYPQYGREGLEFLKALRYAKNEEGEK